MRVWIVGTSVSIESGGYASQLTVACAAEQIHIENLSVGDQGSMMGVLRILAKAEDKEAFGAGDVVIWEYSLLDHYLSEGIYWDQDLIAARRHAWHYLLARGARVIALHTPPLGALATPTEMERIATADARAAGIAVVDWRSAFNFLQKADGSDPATHYRDDRHPNVDSPASNLIAQQLFQLLQSPQAAQRAPAHWQQPWRFVGLSDWTGVPVRRYQNSLMEIPAALLAVDAGVPLPRHRRVLAVGVVSEHSSGALWCTHAGCPPVSTKLPDALNYRFLLRTTAIACRRSCVETLTAAPVWAFRNGAWQDYGQAPLPNLPNGATAVAPIALFGVLLELDLA